MNRLDVIFGSGVGTDGSAGGEERQWEYDSYGRGYHRDYQTKAAAAATGAPGKEYAGSIPGACIFSAQRIRTGINVEISRGKPESD